MLGRPPPTRRNPWIRPAPQPGSRPRTGFLDRCLDSRNRRSLTSGARSRSRCPLVRVNVPIDRRRARRGEHSRRRLFPRSAGWKYPLLNARTRYRLLRSGYRPAGAWSCRLQPVRSMDRTCAFRRPGRRSRCRFRRPRPFRCLLPRRCPYRCHRPRHRSRWRHLHLNRHQPENHLRHYRPTCRSVPRRRFRHPRDKRRAHPSRSPPR